MMKKNIRLLSFLAIIIFAFSACSTAEKPEPLDMVAVKAEIQAMEDAYAAAEKAKDADAVAAYYSEDAISYSRNTQPVSGRAAIRDRIAERIANDTLGNYNVYKVVDLFAEGNSAVEIGSWTEFNTEGTETENGYYMSYFEKRDGKYECVRDMSLTTMPEKEGM
ncbi:nuclear transport factor 2 family protein [Maribacter arenosus]|uniref:Nuclear transport factor 2 family protein n=1 Tax=Maribacter arenosus TaxID=1854708 RepID=A0ABR7VED8_9FLAO|nr:nuclear transport factor 2 family protein [Maribacter arenosus]MBD0851235.1 nuclear transport factor 2 family protein [Maribacter arenosus]